MLSLVQMGNTRDINVVNWHHREPVPSWFFFYKDFIDLISRKMFSYLIIVMVKMIRIRDTVMHELDWGVLTSILPSVQAPPFLQSLSNDHHWHLGYAVILKKKISIHKFIHK